MNRRFGRTAVVTIGGLVTATACGLVIDPDKLIADNGEPNEAAAPTFDAPSGETGTNDAAIDAGVDAPIPVVPACVPPAPGDAKGPYAVVFGSSATPPSCPSGYLGAAVLTAKTDFDAPPVTCGTAGCVCSSSTGNGSCTRVVRGYGDSACNNAKTPPTVVSGCTSFNGASYVEVDVVVNTPQCNASGSTSPTSKPPATYNATAVACAVDPAIARAPCDGGDVALSPVTNARTCVVPSDGAICPPPYTSVRKLSSKGDVNDTRGCQCTCPTGTTSCTGGTAVVHGSAGCSGAVFDAGLGICRANFGYDSVDGVDPTPTGLVTCTPQSKVTGTATPVEDVTLCCLP